MLKVIEVPVKLFLTIVVLIGLGIFYPLAFLEKRKEQTLGAIGLFFILYMWVWMFSGEEPIESEQVSVAMPGWFFLALFLTWAVTSSIFMMALFIKQNKYIDLALMPALALVLLMGYPTIMGLGVLNILPHSRDTTNLFLIILINFLGLFICLKRIRGKPLRQILVVPALARWLDPVK